MLVDYYFFLSLYFVPLASFLLLPFTKVMCHTVEMTSWESAKRKAYGALSRPLAASSLQLQLALIRTYYKILAGNTGPEDVTTRRLGAGLCRDGAEKKKTDGAARRWSELTNFFPPSVAPAASDSGGLSELEWLLQVWKSDVGGQTTARKQHFCDLQAVEAFTAVTIELPKMIWIDVIWIDLNYYTWWFRYFFPHFQLQIPNLLPSRGVAVHRTVPSPGRRHFHRPKIIFRMIQITAALSEWTKQTDIVGREFARETGERDACYLTNRDKMGR